MCIFGVVGNCIRNKPLPKPKYGTSTDSSGDIEAVKELDYIIQQLIVSKLEVSESKCLEDG